MSGQAGGRGYLIQALISVLDAVTDDTAWTAMELEPNLASEKIDVIWHYTGRTKVVQIKSSQNQITVPDVRAWANDLEGSITAAEYELRLIGPVSAGVAEIETCGAVRIPTPQPLHLDGLLHQAAHKLDLYFRTRNLTSLTPGARELVVHALVTRLAGQATHGTPIERAASDRVLRSWITEIQQAARLGDAGTNVGSDLAKELLNTYLAVGHLLGLLAKEIELVHDWTHRIKGDDEIGGLTIHFAASSLIFRLRSLLAEIEEWRIRRGWLMPWKANALLYAIQLKGAEVLRAVERYGSERNDWELKRGHLLAASSISSVVSEYASMCSKEVTEDLKQYRSNSHVTLSDEEFKAFAKVLGDIGRAESKRFSEEHPELWQRLRNANRLLNEEDVLRFKYKLLAERMLDPQGANTLELTPQQRIAFLEKLYEQCLAFYFRMWNEPLDEAAEESEILKIKRLLKRQSTDAILAAFTEMVVSIKKTFQQAQVTPATRKDFDSDDAFEKARLTMLKPSAIVYHSLQGLIDSHLAELKDAK